jgi:5-methylcytosine-specific restriction endonuclease McrA
MSGPLRYAKNPLAHLMKKSPQKAEADAFYGSHRWKELRARFLRKNPLCARCQGEGRVSAATLVHHMLERLKHPELAFEWNNLEGLCAACHNRHHKAKRST